MESERLTNGSVATDDVEIMSERKLRSPEFKQVLTHDPFGENYSDSEKGGDDGDLDATCSVRSDSEGCRLKREVGFAGCLSLVVGVMIGSGIFASPLVVFGQAKSAGMSLVVWAGCGVLCILSSLCYAELGTAFHASGGEKTYLSKAFGELVGFLYSWTAILIVKPAAIAGVSLAFAHYVVEPIYRNDPNGSPMWLIKVLAACGIGEYRWHGFYIVLLLLGVVSLLFYYYWGGFYIVLLLGWFLFP